jgi:hypothetical protein
VTVPNSNFLWEFSAKGGFTAESGEIETAAEAARAAVDVTVKNSLLVGLIEGAMFSFPFSKIQD